MVLYAVYHGGHLPLAVLHKLIYHRNDEAILLAGNTYERHVGASMDLSKFHKIFSRIVLYKAIYGMQMKGTQKEIEQAICNEYDCCFTKENICLDSFEQIYNIADAQDSLGIYMSIKNLRWTVIEDVPGKFDQYANKPRFVYNANSTASKDYVDILFAREIYQFYSNELIVPVKYQDFNLVSNLEQIEKTDQELILHMYGMDTRQIYKEVLFLPSSHGFLVSVPQKDNPTYNLYFPNGRSAYFMCNATIMDFTKETENNFDIKPHPSMLFTLVDEKGIYNYPRYFPAEFMPFLPELNYKILLGFASNSIKNLSKLIDIPTVISYATTTARQIHLFYRVYISYVICNTLFSGEFAFFGLKKDILQDIDQNANIDFPQTDGYTELLDLKKNVPFTIINNSDYKKPTYKTMLVNYIRNSAPNDVIAVINSEDDYSFIHKDFDFTEFMVPVYIRKNVLSEHAVGNFNRETVYFFCKNAKIRDKIRSFSYSRELHYTGIELSVVPATELELMEERQQLVTRRINLQQIVRIKKIVEDQSTALTVPLVAAGDKDAVAAELLKLKAEISKKNTLLKEQDSEITILKERLEQYAGMEDIYADGLTLSVLRWTEKHFPKGSAKRERMKKFARKYMKKEK